MPVRARGLEYLYGIVALGNAVWTALLIRAVQGIDLLADDGAFESPAGFSRLIGRQRI
jgi:hypothetical protein